MNTVAVTLAALSDPPMTTLSDTLAVPVTASVALGAVLPIPTLPDDSMVITSRRPSRKLPSAREISSRVLEFVLLFSYLERRNSDAAPKACPLVPCLASNRTVRGSLRTVALVGVWCTKYGPLVS